MNDVIHHRIISAPTLTELWKRTTLLQADNWKPVDEPSIAIPANPSLPPYWTQALSRADAADEKGCEDIYAAVVAAPSLMRCIGNS